LQFLQSQYVLILNLFPFLFYANRGTMSADSVLYKPQYLCMFCRYQPARKAHGLIVQLDQQLTRKKFGLRLSKNS